MKRLLPSILLIFVVETAIAQQQPICNPYPRTISVSGSSELEIVPDEIYVQVDLKEYKKRGGEKVELEKIKEEFLAVCRLAGIPDSVISIASYEGVAGVWWKKKKKDPELFSTISYQIKFNSSKKMDDLIARLNDEATTDFKIVKVWHSKMTEYRKQLKIAAVKAAKEKALYLTEAVNEKIGPAITIEEPTDLELGSNNIQANNTLPTYNFNTKYFTVQTDSPGIDFKKIKLQFHVNIVYALQ